MSLKGKSKLVPEQQTGKPIDAESSVELPEEKSARIFFEKVKDRLQHVERWKDYAGNLSAQFQLVDQEGVDVQRPPQKGDYFKIDIPGPGSKTGAGYDWVQIEEVESSSTPHSEMFGFRVRPTDNPQDTRKDVAHFYSQESTSSFVVARNGNRVTASIHDRNTKPNTEADSAVGKIRDTVVGTVGVLSLSKIQWQQLTDGLVQRT